MLNVWITAAGVLLLAGLLYHEKTGARPGLVINKTALSLLFIVAAVVQPHPIPMYYALLLAGLAFCLAGDMFLALTFPKAFLLGLASFLIGHLCYILAFASQTVFSAWISWASLVVLAVSVYVYYRLRPHLGDMRLPVLAYVVVITFMLCGAWAVMDTTGLTFSGKMLAFGGAACFYLSDIFVARDRFIGEAYINRLIGLPLYYAGQFMLAFSSGALGWL